MTASGTQKFITANHLLDGEVVYLGEQHTWVRDLAMARLFDADEAASAALTKAQAQEDIVVGPYVAEAKGPKPDHSPAHFREKFRSRGPSNYAHGKQEAIQNVRL